MTRGVLIQPGSTRRIPQLSSASASGPQLDSVNGSETVRHQPWPGHLPWRPVWWLLPWREVWASACDFEYGVYFEIGLAALDPRIRRYDWTACCSRSPLEPSIGELITHDRDQAEQWWEQLLDGSYV